MKRLGLFLILVFAAYASLAQTGMMKGTIIDKNTDEPLIGATIILVGTYKGAATDFNGDYTVDNIKPGEYTVKISYIGYAEKKLTGVKIFPDSTTTLSTTMVEFADQIETVVIEGERTLVDLESATSKVSISAEDIKDMNTNDVQDIVKMQAGVVESPDGIQIRGSRVYETNYVVDGISAKDPLSGSGFGVQVASSSVQSVDVITGGGNAEYSDATGGVIITNIKEGGDSLETFVNWTTDNFLGGNNNGSFNTDIVDFAIGGPVPFTSKKLKFYANLNMQLDDTYYGHWARQDRGTWNDLSRTLSDQPTDKFYTATADQLHSSILEDKFMGVLGNEGREFYAPRQNNTWSNTIKLSYKVSGNSKLTLTQQNSVKVNQSDNSLRIVGNDAVVQPGYQYFFGNDLDRATTYTHKAYLTAINYSINLTKRLRLEFIAGRLFTRLRGDANGRPFRVSPDQQRNFDARSVITMPASVFDTTSGFSTPDRYSLKPTTGLSNNDGISSLWHDHHVEEFTGKVKFLRFTDNNVHTVSGGWEHKEQEFQWIDVSAPWVGAPVQYIDETGTPQVTDNIRIGSQSEIFTVRPALGSIFLSDEINYNGLKAVIGGMFKYWAPGQYLDDAAKNPAILVPQEFKDNYLNESTPIGGRRFKARFLPNVNVTFPVTENNIMYFNYGHSMQMPQPRFMYIGLNPKYNNYSRFSSIGNPDLDPEVSISYELGYKSQITKNIGVTVTAFYNDRFDYIYGVTANVQTAQGNRPLRINTNQDYARIRGLELGYSQRFLKYLKVFSNFSYQVATGKSSTAADAAVLGLGREETRGATEEQFLAWDTPFNFKSGLIFRPDSSFKVLGKDLTGFRAFLSFNWRSGLRYTEAVYDGTFDNGRPRYATRPDVFYNKVGKSQMWADVKFSYDVRLYRKLKTSFSFEVKNILGRRNPQRINPVTGRAYAPYDPVLDGARDPNPAYLTPDDSDIISGLSPDRFRQPRQFLFGITIRY